MEINCEWKVLEGEVIDILSDDTNEFKSMKIKKSNALIRGRYSTSLLANKVTALSMTRLLLDDKGRPTAAITAAEIKEAVGWGGGNSIYSQLRQVAIELRTAPIILENGSGSFYVTGMVDNCLYNNGVFKITFSLDMVPHLFDLQKNYTTLTIKSLMKFKSNSTYRIYEMIREHVYKITEEDPIICVSYSLSELRAKLGLIDFTRDDKKLLTKATIASKDDDMEKIAKKVKYRTWSEFKRNVLDVARKELMKKSEITFDYTQKIQGRGGKVLGVKFYIHRNISPEYVNSVKEMQEFGNGMEQLELFNLDGNAIKEVNYKFIGDMQEIIEEEIPVTSLIKIAEAAEYDLKKVKEAYKFACGSKSIKNLAGFMVSALQERWSMEPVPKVQGLSQESAKMLSDMADESHRRYVERCKNEEQQKNEEANDSIKLFRIKDHQEPPRELRDEKIKEESGKQQKTEENNEKQLERIFKTIDSLPEELKNELVQRMLAGEK